MFVLQDSLGVIARTFVSLALSPLVWESEPRCNDELDALVLGSLTHPLLAPQGGFDSLGGPLRRACCMAPQSERKARGGVGTSGSLFVSILGGVRDEEVSTNYVEGLSAAVAREFLEEVRLFGHEEEEDLCLEESSE